MKQKMYQCLLLPLDGSALAEQALPHAVAQAESFQAKLILLKVLEPLAKSLNLPIEAARKAEEVTHELARDYLERIAASVRKSGIPVQTITVNGYAHKEIVRFAEVKQVDLIVMCTRGHSGFSRWLMGSVADRVVRGADVPVLLISTRQEKTKKHRGVDDEIPENLGTS